MSTAVVGGVNARPLLPPLARRAFLRGLTGVGVYGLTPHAVSARADIDPTRVDTGPAIEFDGCDTAFVTAASAVETVTVYYARPYGVRAARYDIPATKTDTRSHRPVTLAFDALRDSARVALNARGALVHVVAENSEGTRVVAATSTEACVPTGFNSPPAAGFTASTADRSATDGERLPVWVDEAVTMSSTATDSDWPTERLRFAWDLDGDGVFETSGPQVTTMYTEPGSVVVGHRVTDDFDASAEVTLTVVVRQPWLLRRKLTPSGVGPGDQFGLDIVVSDDMLVATAPGDDDGATNSGATYVFDCADLSASPTKLIPAHQHSGDLGGISVTVAGDALAVSAVCDDEAGTDAGAVYVYDLTDFSVPPTKLAPSILRRQDFLGISLAGLGDTLVAGAHLDNERADWGGSVFVFDLADRGESPLKLAPDSMGERDLFGISVAVTSEAIIGGAIGDDDAGTQAGAVYVYDRDDLSAPPTKLVPGGVGPGDQIGRPLAALDETLVVGAYFDDERGALAGAVYLYDLGDLTAAPTKLVPENLQAGDLFGYAVALSDEVLAVGAIGDDEAGFDSGAVYVYDRNDPPGAPVKLTPTDATPGNLFGATVAVAGDTLAVGAIFDKDRGTNAGAVYVYER